MATGTAMDTYEQGKETKGAADAMKAEAEEHLGHFNTLKTAIMDFAGSPVIGPVVFWIMHRIVACFTVAFFFYTLIAAVPSFSAKVTSAEVEYLTDYQLPDIYSCLDGETMKKFLTKQKQDVTKQGCRDAVPRIEWDQCEFEMMDGSKRKGTFEENGTPNTENGKGGNVMQFRSGLSGDTRCGAYNMAYHNLKTGVEDAGECPVEELRFGTPGYFVNTEDDAWSASKPAPEFEDRLNFQAWLPEDYEGDSVDADGFDDKAGKLATLLPNATGDIINDDGTTTSVTVPALCFRNAIKDGAKSYYETNQDLVLGMSTRIFPQDAVSPLKKSPSPISRLIALAPFTPCALLIVRPQIEDFGIVWYMYFTERNVEPYMEHEGQLHANATRLFIQGANTLTKIDLRPLNYKDATIGMSSYTLDFEQSTSFSAPGQNPTQANKGTENKMMFTFLHFARRVTIRYKTISEVWAEVGGLWAAATLIMAMIFSQSGTTDPRNKKPSVIFNFLPSKMRKKWIEENNMKLKAAGAEEVKKVSPA